MSVNVNVCDMHDNMHDSQREITAWVYVLILRREENRRTRRKTVEVRERPTTTTLLTLVPSLRINTVLYPGGHLSTVL